MGDPSKRLAETTIMIDRPDLAALRKLSRATSIPMAEYVRTWIQRGLYGVADDDWIRHALRKIGIQVPGRPGRDVWTLTVDEKPMTWKRTIQGSGVRSRARITEAAMRARKLMIGWLGLSRRPKRWPTDQRYALAVRVYLPNRSGEGDASNYAKLVEDALEGIVWANDKQIDLLLVAKIIGGHGEPRTEVEIARIDPDDDIGAQATLGAR